MSIERFSPETIEKLGYYVYRLVDPRNGQTFYVGKGKGDRVFQHSKSVEKLREDLKKEQDEGGDDTYKIRTIKEILGEGFEVITLIHRHGMSEETAFQVEAALIDAYAPAGNIQPGHNSLLGCQNCEQIENLYKRPEADLGGDKVLFLNVSRHLSESDSVSVNDEIYRAAWRLNKARASQADYVLAVKDSVIVGVYKPSGWHDSKEYEGRICFGDGVVTEESVISRYKGRRVPSANIPTKGAQNPCWYNY